MGGVADQNHAASHREVDQDLTSRAELDSGVVLDLG